MEVALVKGERRWWRRGGAKSVRLVQLLVLARVLWTFLRRHILSELRITRLPKQLGRLGQQRPPFLAFSGSGLLLAYYHGVATYLRDHFHLDNLRVSGISGGGTTLLGLTMGVDLLQVLLVGLHMKKEFLQDGLSGIYMRDFDATLESTLSKLKAIGITDEATADLSAKGACFLGVTQCFPLPQHRCVPAPGTVRELAALILSSMAVVPFFRTPGKFQGTYYVDGGFSAAYSLPDDQPWSEVIKICPFPWWASLGPPTMSFAQIQPQRLMLAEVLLLFPWSHYQKLIKLGYDDTKRSHSLLVDRGLRPLSNAPVTPWEEWQTLFESIDEDNLPPLSCERRTRAVSQTEKAHDDLLRTHSHSDLCDLLRGPRARRMSSGKLGSQSMTEMSSLTSVRC